MIAPSFSGGAFSVGEGPISLVTAAICRRRGMGRRLIGAPSHGDKDGIYCIEANGHVRVLVVASDM